MRQWFVAAVLVGSAVAGGLSVFILFRMFRAPDTESALLGGLWVAMPFLGAAGLALLLRRSTAALTVLLVSLLIAGPIGVSILDASAIQQEITEQQAADAVHPGEDASNGPAAMRKTGADVGAAIGGVFSILIVVIVPPVQLVAMIVPTMIGYGVAALLRKRKAGSLDDRDSDTTE